MSQIVVRRFAAGGTNSSAPIPSVMRAFIGIAPRANGIAWPPVEKMLDNISGARDVVISVALYLARYNVVAHNRGLGKTLPSSPGLTRRSRSFGTAVPR